MTAVDITADLNDEDDTGYVWTFLDEARDPSLIAPGAIVVAGTPDAPAVAEVVDLVTKPAGTVVHLRILPGRSATTPPPSLAPRRPPEPSDPEGDTARSAGPWLPFRAQPGRSVPRPAEPSGRSLEKVNGLLDGDHF